MCLYPLAGARYFPLEGKVKNKGAPHHPHYVRELPLKGKPRISESQE